MALFRPIAIILRNILMKRHAYFSCCASCGDIRTPLEHRLCASLSPGFDVDVVLLPDRRTGTAAQPASVGVSAVRERMPWVRRIWLPEQDCAPGDEVQGTCVLRIREAMSAYGYRQRSAGSASHPEALLHCAEGLADYYIVVRDSSMISKNLLCLDFFTPNGIPLIFAITQDGQPEKAAASSALPVSMQARGLVVEPLLMALPGVYAQTRENAEAFAEVYSELAVSGDELDYCQALAQWSFATARAIPCAWTHCARSETRES